MIDALKFISSFCFWLILAVFMLFLVVAAVYVLVTLIRTMRERHD